MIPNGKELGMSIYLGKKYGFMRTLEQVTGGHTLWLDVEKEVFGIMKYVGKTTDFLAFELEEKINMN